MCIISGEESDVFQLFRVSVEIASLDRLAKSLLHILILPVLGAGRANCLELELSPLGLEVLLSEAVFFDTTQVSLSRDEHDRRARVLRPDLVLKVVQAVEGVPVVDGSA